MTTEKQARIWITFDDHAGVVRKYYDTVADLL